MCFVELKTYRTVQEIMCKLNDHEVGELRTRQFWRKAEHLRMQAKVGQITEQFWEGSFPTALCLILSSFGSPYGQNWKCEAPWNVVLWLHVQYSNCHQNTNASTICNMLTAHVFVFTSSGKGWFRTRQVHVLFMVHAAYSLKLSHQHSRSVLIISLDLALII